MNSQVPTPPMGILNVKKVAQKFQLQRYVPSQNIDFFVKHYWIVTWDLTGQAPYRQHVIPNPCVNMVFENKGTGIFGPAKQKTSHLLDNKGTVFGIKFKPGGFYPFYQRRVSQLSDRSIRVSDIFDVDDRDAEIHILSQCEDADKIALVEEIIRRRLPDQDDMIPLLHAIMDKIQEDREVIRVDMLSEMFGHSVRTLQRIFDRYVGVSPKWVIKLYRLQNAAETMEANDDHDWPQIAADLGYFDQAHFIKDFRTIIGVTPDEYVRQLHTT